MMAGQIVGSGSLHACRPFSANNGVTQITVTTRRAVLSIRQKSSLVSAFHAAEVVLKEMHILGRTNDALWEVVRGSILSGSPTWSSVHADSFIEYSVHDDAAAGALSGGKVVSSGYVLSGSVADFDFDSDGDVPHVMLPMTAVEVISVVLTTISVLTAASAALLWCESG